MKNEKSQQTRISFKDKWEENSDLTFSETLREGSDIFNWILNRNGFKAAPDFKHWLTKRKRILDAGCGNGRVTALLRQYAPADSDIVGIDLVSADVAGKNLEGLEKVTVFQKDLLADLTDLGKFDLIYCQEVLHHTEDPLRAFLNLCERLTDNGEIAIYVYKRKAPIREFADDYVREQISGLSYPMALEKMKEITELGRILADLKISVTVPKVEVLGIEAGEYDIQRFFYHFFLKCFWNDALSFTDNAAINYDWYHPQICYRYTLDEIETWFEKANLKIIHRCVDNYGITIRGTK